MGLSIQLCTDYPNLSPKSYIPQAFCQSGMLPIVMDQNSNLPQYYAVNDRPVKMIATPEGGRDVLVMNMRTGELNAT